MREIKFRAWDNVHKSLGCQMVYHGPGCNLKTLADFWQWINQHNPMPIEQYTGLKDKNGQEIYEGDIVAAPFNDSKHRTKIFNYPVVFTAGNPLCTSHDPRFTFEWWRDFTRKDYRWIPLLSECEVIGNIHENPELLV